MSHVVRRLFAVIFSAVLATAPVMPSALADTDAVSEDLLNRHNQTINTLKQRKGEGGLDDDAALEIIREFFSPAIDFTVLSKRAVGKHWRKIDDDARRKITASFQQLLENTYAKVLARYRDQEVTLAGAKALDNGGMSVSIRVYGGGGKGADIEYLLTANDAGDFLISDIKVESISLVANYRRQFGRIIRKEGADGLISALEKLNRSKQ